MKFRDKLEGLSRPAMVEAVYLCGRFLTHGLTRETFLHQLEADVRTNYRHQSVAVVFEIMSEIEAKEGASIHAIPMSKRFDYANDLSDLLWERIEPSTDAAQVERALAELEEP